MDTTHERQLGGLIRRVGWIIVMASSFLILPDDARARPAGLTGSWSGGGWVDFASGKREIARCRARFTARSETSYSVNAVCATPSGRVSQTATLRRTGANRYSGSFYNSEYDVSGTISITVSGNSSSVRLSSDRGSAVLSLSR